MDKPKIKRRIYVASSWRNKPYLEVVKRLREAGHEVYALPLDKVSCTSAKKIIEFILFCSQF